MTNTKRKAHKPTDLTKSEKVQTVNEIMSSMEGEIEAVKNGSIPLPQARAITNMRKLQLQGVSLYLQYARMEQRMRPLASQRFGLPELEAVVGKVQ